MVAWALLSDASFPSVMREIRYFMTEFLSVEYRQLEGFPNQVREWLSQTHSGLKPIRPAW